MKSQGVGKGDDVTIYMPMIPEVRPGRVHVGTSGLGWVAGHASLPAGCAPEGAPALGQPACAARCTSPHHSLTLHACPSSLPPPAPQLPAVMLACARIGAVFSVVFAGFSAESLAGRISDSGPKMVRSCCVCVLGPARLQELVSS